MLHNENNVIELNPYSLADGDSKTTEILVRILNSVGKERFNSIKGRLAKLNLRGQTLWDFFNEYCSQCVATFEQKLFDDNEILKFIYQPEIEGRVFNNIKSTDLPEASARRISSDPEKVSYIMQLGTVLGPILYRSTVNKLVELGIVDGVLSEALLYCRDDYFTLANRVLREDPEFMRFISDLRTKDDPHEITVYKKEYE